MEKVEELLRKLSDHETSATGPEWRSQIGFLHEMLSLARYAVVRAHPRYKEMDIAEAAEIEREVDIVGLRAYLEDLETGMKRHPLTGKLG